MAVPKRVPKGTDRLSAHFKKELEREGMADKNLHNKLANRVVQMKWQKLPYTTEVIDGVEQGAHDTYWVNPHGRMLEIGHASGYNWREEGKLIADGPWFQVSKKSVGDVFMSERLRAESAEYDRKEARRELKQLRKKLAKLLDMEED